MTEREEPLWEGLLLIDKPAGCTSHDVVAKVRWLTGRARTGHAGTLDPMATGLLPLVLGRASRLVRFLPGSPKDYEGTLRLGLRTSSDDITGEVLERHEGPLPDAETVLDAAAGLTGEFDQMPPAVSARKVGGKRLYKLARQGVEAKVTPRRVQVSRFELSPGDEPGEFRFEASVSAGTYIRSLARDLGQALGCGGTLASLRRTRIGPLDVADAVPVPGLDLLTPEMLRSGLRSLAEMPLSPPPVDLGDPEEVRRFLSGNPLVAPEGLSDGFCRVLGPDGRLLGVAEISEAALRPRVVVASLPGPRAL
ncbi:hypothetical protein ABI59_24040 [Acidobacteria bacterium Mor1]|nr:hypothetical protein ABI59_24040 [Acidobacteria bacterium Mor1]